MSTKKLTIQEWLLNEQTSELELREIKFKVRVKRNQNLDNYYIKYKNTPVPVNMSYIKNGVLNVVNFENSFIPFKSMNVEFTKIDNATSKPTLVIQKLKDKLEETEKLNISIETYRKLIDREKDALKSNGYKLQIKSLEKQKQEVKLPPESVIKSCGIAMNIRSWFIQNEKRLVMKHNSFWEKYQNIIVIILFFVFSLCMVFIVMDTSGKITAENIKALTDAIANGIKGGINTPTTTLQTIPV